MKTLGEILVENIGLDKQVYLLLNGEILSVYENVDECFRKSSVVLLNCYCEKVPLATNVIDIFIKVGNFKQKFHI